ncbi:hypothetical protein D3C73_1436980 [compost metagenome]
MPNTNFSKYIGIESTKLSNVFHACMNPSTNPSLVCHNLYSHTASPIRIEITNIMILAFIMLFNVPQAAAKP